MGARAFSLAALAAFAVPAGALAAGDPVMPLARVRAGMKCTGRTVVQGTTISAFDVRVLDVVDDGSGDSPRILVRVSGPAVDDTGIGEGFSGSPIYCPDAANVSRVIGAISSTLGDYGNKTVLATPIETMLGEPVHPPAPRGRRRARGHDRAPASRGRRRARGHDGAPGRRRAVVAARRLVAPLAVSGLGPALGRVLRQAGERAGHPVLAAPAGPYRSFPPQSLVPGASVAAGLSSGAVATGAVGTVSYRDGDTVYAFGHPLDGVGRRRLLLEDAYVFGVIGNPLGQENAVSYKLAAPGQPLGTLTADTPNAIIGHVGSVPATVPVTVRALDRDTGRVRTTRSDVVDETDVGLPTGSSALTMVAPLTVAQAGTGVLDGAPADESGSLCLRIRVRESRRALGFCRRYAESGPVEGADSAAVPGAMGGDAASAVGLVEGTAFAALHVTRIDGRLEVGRGLSAADLIRVSGPRTVSAGRRITVRLRAQVPRGRPRTIRARLTIPADLPPGRASAVLAGVDKPSADLGDQLTVTLGGAGDTPAPPGSLTALRRAVAALGGYDGVRARFPGARRRGRALPAQRVVRDRTLVLRGAVTLRFRVRR